MDKTWIVMVNSDCNLRCKYCFEDKTNKTNSVSNIKIYMDNIIRSLLDSPGNAVVDLFGGEPFLHLPLLDEVTDYFMDEAEKYNVQDRYMFNLTTNGTLFNNDSAKAFIKKISGNCHVGFSIDGPRHIHDVNRVTIDGNGSYDKAVEGFHICKEYIPIQRLSAKATINHATMHDWETIVRHLLDLGFKRVGANVVFEETWGEEEFYILAPQFINVAEYLYSNNLLHEIEVDQINKGYSIALSHPDSTSNSCGACIHMRCLGIDGKVYGCQKFGSVTGMPHLGEIKDGDIVITNSNIISEVTNSRKYLDKYCADCLFKAMCYNCVADAYAIGISVDEMYSRKSQCGYTCAKGFTKLYLLNRE
ncbi:MAG: 4Fe-4S cluster-binding domain-containing protein [Paludibacteraceae bacterium]|nr:4Fe-4S cluster-binding domain-containing protein [Paludibacteraceae bacterium]